MVNNATLATAGTVSPHLTRLLLRAGSAMGLDRSRLEGVAGLAVLGEDSVRIPTATILRVWELVSSPAWEAAGTSRVMRLWRPGALGVWDYLFSAAGTVGDALHAASRNFAAIADPADRLVLGRDDDGLTIAYHGSYQDHPQYGRIAELVPYMLLTVASAGAGRPLAPVRVRLPRRPAGPPDRLRELYRTGRVEFEGEHPSVTFAEADADDPLPGPTRRWRPSWRSTRGCPRPPPGPCSAGSTASTPRWSPRSTAGHRASTRWRSGWP
ncbi:AraC family transcriptional regulator ligand-binding domain-containing protein [Nonomuraea thailandensis]